MRTFSMIGFFGRFFMGLAMHGFIRSSAAIERRGKVPFLNGGLFEMQEYDSRNAVHIPNDKFAEILELFERYNFSENPHHLTSRWRLIQKCSERCLRNQ